MMTPFLRPGVEQGELAVKFPSQGHGILSYSGLYAPKLLQSKIIQPIQNKEIVSRVKKILWIRILW